jgi:transposase-like protein
VQLRHADAVEHAVEVEEETLSTWHETDRWHLDEVFIRINGQQQYLCRAVDQDGDVIDILVQRYRDQRAAERFFRRLLRGQGAEPLRIITDKLRSYSAAMRTIFGNVTHTLERYATEIAITGSCDRDPSQSGGP